MPTLVHLSVSPWSEKARWALDHHQVRCRRIEYMPMVGELPLRLRAGSLFDRVTVPILFDAEGRDLKDSYDIARWAEEVGRGGRLFPHDHLTEISEHNAASEIVLTAGRARVTPRLLSSPQALDEALPKPLRKLGKVARLGAQQGTRFILRKYGADKVDIGEQLRRMRSELDALRAALDGNDYLFGAFTYADLARAVSLQMVSPVADAHYRIGRATRDVWIDHELAAEYADLLEWRDRVYALHR